MIVQGTKVYFKATLQKPSLRRLKEKHTNHHWIGIQTHGQYCELPPCHGA